MSLGVDNGGVVQKELYTTCMSVLALCGFVFLFFLALFLSRLFVFTSAYRGHKDTSRGPCALWRRVC